MIRTFVQDHQKTKKLLAVLRSFKPDLLLLNKKIWLRYDEVFFRHQCVPLDRPKMGSQNQKCGFAQSLKISIFSVPKLHNYVHGSF